MRVLLDHNLPVRLLTSFPKHQVAAAREMGWDQLTNGDLLKAATQTGFEVLLTGDKKLEYQQRHLARTLSIVLLSETKVQHLLPALDLISAALDRATPGSFEELVVRVVHRRRRR